MENLSPTVLPCRLLYGPEDNLDSLNINEKKTKFSGSQLINGTDLEVKSIKVTNQCISK
jgi:hypothetical protein